MSIKDWLSDYRLSIHASIESCSLSKLTEWIYNKRTIERQDKAYFLVIAITSDNNLQPYKEIPIIHQPEIGILGFLMCTEGEDWKILVQAKSEPGNVNLTQIGPSVQATFSNYMSVHGGKKQAYLEFFTDNNIKPKYSIKQSEQGTRFYNKYNLNVIVEVDESQIVITEAKYSWFSFSEIIHMLNEDYVFNTDFKSVSTQLVESYILKNKHKKDNPIIASYLNYIDESSVNRLLQEIDFKRNRKGSIVQEINLCDLQDWNITEDGISPVDKKEFGFSYYNVYLEDREITHWSQPLISKKSIEYIDLYVCEINNAYHFVFFERNEIGFKNAYQLAPTIQLDSLEVVKDSGHVLVSFNQSEEGGRFYKNISRYRIVKIDSLEPYADKEGYVVLNMYQVCALLKIEGIFTNEARSMLSSLFSLI